MKKRKMFLRWCLINILTFSLIFLVFFLYSGIAQKLGIIGIIMVSTIIFIFIVATTYCGALFWKADGFLDTLDKVSKDNVYDVIELLHLINSRANHVWQAAETCPYIGLMGAATGILILTTGSSGLGGSAQISSVHVKAIISNILVGVGIALMPTIVGIFFMLILRWGYHILTNTVEYAIEKFERATK